MTTVLLYWNNICVLHKKELTFLEGITRRLADNDIRLEVRCFGLGYPSHMSDYLRRRDAVLPDVIVSTDLEVYEDRRIFDRFKDSLYPAVNWVPLKRGEGAPSVLRGTELIPFLIIPMVFYTGSPAMYEGAGIRDLIERRQSLTFGGINNSAAKTVVKTVWSRYGRDAAVRLTAEGTVTGMPVQAFQRVHASGEGVALVPTIFALRADEQSRFARCPADGAVAVPSYICARSSIPEDTAQTVIRELTGVDICNFFVDSGDVVCCIDGSNPQTWMAQRGTGLQLPDGSWLARTPPEEFYSLYCAAIPSAIRP